MTDSALFHRIDSIVGILSLPEVREKKLQYSLRTEKFFFLKKEVENTYGRFPCVQDKKRLWNK